MPGALFVRGVNYYGRFGTDQNVCDFYDPAPPLPYTRIGTDNDWVKAVFAFTHSLALKADGSLWASGSNLFGELGLGDDTDRHQFVRVGTDTWLDMLVSGTFVYNPQGFSLGIKSDGSLWGWGIDLYSIGFPIYDALYVPTLLFDDIPLVKLVGLEGGEQSAYGIAALAQDGRVFTISDFSGTFAPLAVYDPNVGNYVVYSDWVSIKKSQYNNSALLRRANGDVYYWQTQPCIPSSHVQTQYINDSQAWLDFCYAYNVPIP